MKKTDIQYIHDLLTKLDDRLDDLDTKFDTKLSVLDSKLHSLDKTADMQRVSLDEHIRRTHLLEQALKPIQKHVSTVQTIFTFVCKFVGAIAVLAGIWASIRG